MCVCVFTKWAVRKTLGRSLLLLLLGNRNGNGIGT